jgi:Fur family transcriptional regulator, ferric uptake regulator
VTWREHALAVLRESGYRSGGARATVLEVLAAERCCLSVPAIHARVRRRRPGVGMASVYRALEALAELGLVHKLELGAGGAQYEPAAPGGEHHHHLVCGDCGKVEPFEDPALEKAIAGVAGGRGYDVAAHEVVLRGACGDCRP